MVQLEKIHVVVLILARLSRLDPHDKNIMGVILELGESIKSNILAQLHEVLNGFKDKQIGVTVIDYVKIVAGARMAIVTSSCVKQHYFFT